MNDSSKKEQGYSSSLYSQSLSYYGTPVYLTHSQGYLLERSIFNTEYRDAVNPYPLYTCQKWSQLSKDIEELKHRWVSLSLVTDPFGDIELESLKLCFPDKLILFKEHFIIDLQQAPQQFVSSHHRRNVRKGLKQCQIEKVDQPLNYLDDWQNCLNTLVEKHDLQGLNAYHNVCFKTLFSMPGTIIFRAFSQSETLGFIIWVCQGQNAYYHLAAYYPSGYQLLASFALFWSSIEYFKSNHFNYLNLGAGAGLTVEESGLTRFKRGWSTGVKPVYLGGKICNHEQYAQLTQDNKTDFFPAYRH